MSWNIICDSSCDLFKIESTCGDIVYKSVPFYINIEEKEFVDDENLNVQKMVEFMKISKKASSTACPSPDFWREKMEVGKKNICVTISKNLSGSYNSAEIATRLICEEFPEAEAAVIDCCATGPAAVLAVRRLVRLIEEGRSFEEVISGTQQYVKNIHTVFALSCFDNLIKAGRMSKVKGIIAASLDFRGIGVENGGKIEFKTTVRGKKKVMNTMLDIMKENGFNGGDIVISHCLNNPMAQAIKEKIEKENSRLNVILLPTRGLNSYYADREGLIISY